VTRDRLRVCKAGQTMQIDYAGAMKIVAINWRGKA